MKILQSFEEDTVVLHLVGPLAAGAGIQELRQAVNAALRDEGRGLVIDLAGVGYLDAAGVGALVAVHKRALRDGQRVLLTGIRRRVQEILDLTGVAAYLDEVGSEEQALERLRERAAMDCTPLAPHPAGTPV